MKIIIVICSTIFVLLTVLVVYGSQLLSWLNVKAELGMDNWHKILLVLVIFFMLLIPVAASLEQEKINRLERMVGMYSDINRIYYGDGVNMACIVMYDAIQNGEQLNCQDVMDRALEKYDESAKEGEKP